MNFHNTDLDFTNVPTRELRCRMAQMGIQYPVWKAMEAELAARQIILKTKLVREVRANA